MRSKSDQLRFACLAVASAAIALAPVSAQESAAGDGAVDDHDHAPGHVHDDIDPQSFTAAEKIRINRLFDLVFCQCPKESWTKTLNGCPDGCADLQKGQIRTAIKAGKTDREILDEQIRLFSPKVLARTPAEGLTGFTFYWLPFVVLAVAGALVLVVLKVVVKPIEQPAGGALPKTTADRAVADQIERELEEME